MSTTSTSTSAKSESKSQTQTDSANAYYKQMIALCYKDRRVIVKWPKTYEVR